MTQNNTENTSIVSACMHLTQTAKLLEKATMDILALLRNMSQLASSMPDNEETKQLKKLISSTYEVCTFEDIASQHINKAVSILNSVSGKVNIHESQENPLLRGPALQGQQTLSQSDIDKMLNI